MLRFSWHSGALVLAVWPFLCICSTARVASAQSSSSSQPSARELFSQGVALYQQERYAQALENFEQAYALKPHPAVLVNIANCYERLGQRARALDAFGRALRRSEGTLPQPKRDEVLEAIARLTRETATLQLSVEPPSAVVEVDGAPVLESGRVVLDPGEHVIIVRKEGFKPLRETVRLRAADRKEFRLTLTRAQALEAEPLAIRPPEKLTDMPAAMPHDEDEEHSPLTTPVLISAAATLALAVTATVTGVLALQANSEFDDAVMLSNAERLSLERRLEARRDGLEAANRADNLALATDILLGSALVGVGVTTYLFVRETQQAYEKPRVRAALAPGRAGLTLEGKF